MPAVKRGISICRQLVAENPASASDRIMLAFTLGLLGQTPPMGGDYATEALSLLRTLSPEQRETHDAVSAEAMQRDRLAFLDLERGPATRRWSTPGATVAIAERWRRSGSGNSGDPAVDFSAFASLISPSSS